MNVASVASINISIFNNHNNHNNNNYPFFGFSRRRVNSKRLESKTTSTHGGRRCVLLAMGGAAAGSLVIETLGDQTMSSEPETGATRRLILLRHAHSSWDSPTSLRDHDRPLSKSGQADAVKLVLKLRQLDWIPELILSSDALRTRETLKIMQEQVQGFLDAEVHFISSFYSVAAMDGQTADHLQRVICKYSRDEILTVMCMGHNRGWEEAASLFSGSPVELKTCNAALLEASGRSWEEAFSLAGLGGWKLQGIVKPDTDV